MSSQAILLKTTFLVLCTCLLGGAAGFAQRPYITVWKTDNIGFQGSSKSDITQIAIPAAGDYSYTWEEVGKPDNNGSGSGSGITVITFPHAGVYRLSMTPSDGAKAFNYIGFNYKGDRFKLLRIEQWGDVVWSSFERAYRGADNLVITATDTPNLSQVTNMAFAFTGTHINTVPHMNDWDVSRVTDMSYMFSGAAYFNQPVGKWDVSHVTTMKYMFGEAAAFNQDISHWDVSRVTDMSFMFWEASSFNQDISDWNVSRVENMAYMFNKATHFNQPIGKWSVGRVVAMDFILTEASDFDQSLADWDLSRLKGMGGLPFGTISLANTGMSCDNYSSTLKGWANSPTPPAQDVALSAHGLQYKKQAAADREQLTKKFHWLISGDEEGDCQAALEKE